MTRPTLVLKDEGHKTRIPLVSNDEGNKQTRLTLVLKDEGPKDETNPRLK
jgi:hypothetical protein